MVRTRIAPSPTGYPHIGTIYQALFNWAYAHKNHGKFLVRIEDTDRARFVLDAEEVIFRSLDWFLLIEDESPRKNGSHAPYRQSERIDIYQKYAEDLIKNGHAYYAFYPKEDSGKKDYSVNQSSMVRNMTTTQTPPSSIFEMSERGDWVVRMKIPRDQKIIIKDEIRGEIEFDSNEVTEQVLIKSDGFPTYHLAAVVDDHLMKITHVVRAEEWLTSTPKHWLLYEYFGWEKPLFFHTPALRNPDHSKLSKRHGHTSVDWYREEGFLPEAILNYLTLMGWSHPEEKEIFSIDEFVALFDLKDIKPVGPIFDLQKLIWMNGEYIRNYQISNLKSQVLNFDPSLKEIDETILDQLLLIAQTRMKTLKEFRALVWPFLHPVAVQLTPEEQDLKESLKKDIEGVKNWIKDDISKVFFENYIQNKRTNFKMLYKVLLGVDRGLPLADTLGAIGREKTIKLLMTNF